MARQDDYDDEYDDEYDDDLIDEDDDGIDEKAAALVPGVLAHYPRGNSRDFGHDYGRTGFAAGKGSHRSRSNDPTATTTA